MWVLNKKTVRYYYIRRRDKLNGTYTYIPIEAKFINSSLRDTNALMICCLFSFYFNKET